MKLQLPQTKLVESPVSLLLVKVISINPEAHLLNSQRQGKGEGKYECLVCTHHHIFTHTQNNVLKLYYLLSKPYCFLFLSSHFIKPSH